MSVHSIASARLLSPDVMTESLEADGGSAALSTASRTLQESVVEVGVWEAGPGVDTDVEVDELFVVLAGAGSLAFDDGSSLELRPGVVVRLRDGDRTTWDITERIRKLYLI